MQVKLTVLPGKPCPLYIMSCASHRIRPNVMSWGAPVYPQGPQLKQKSFLKLLGLEMPPERFAQISNVMV